jgi:hypothetical protein
MPAMTTLSERILNAMLDEERDNLDAANVQGLLQQLHREDPSGYIKLWLRVAQESDSPEMRDEALRIVRDPEMIGSYQAALEQLRLTDPDAYKVTHAHWERIRQALE